MIRYQILAGFDSNVLLPIFDHVCKSIEKKYCIKLSPNRYQQLQASQQTQFHEVVNMVLNTVLAPKNDRYVEDYPVGFRNRGSKQMHPNVIWHMIYGEKFKIWLIWKRQNDNYARQKIEIFYYVFQSTDLNSYRQISGIICTFFFLCPQHKSIPVSVLNMREDYRRKLFTKQVRKSVGRLEKTLSILDK